MNIGGFDFLILYGAGLFSALAGTFFLKKFWDNSLTYGIKSVIDFDPLQVAYLRGGVKEVIKVGLVGLYNKEKTDQTSENISSVTGIEAVLQRRLKNKARPSSKIYEDTILLEEAKQLCQSYEYELVREKLIFSETTQNVFKTLKYLYYAVFLGFGAFRVTAGILNDKPVLYLVGLMLVAIVLIAPATRLSTLTRRGKRYLEDLTLTYKQKLHDFAEKEKNKKNNSDTEDSSLNTNYTHNYQNDHYDNSVETMALAGLFGASVLADSNPDYGFVEDEPRRNQDSTNNNTTDSSSSTWNSADSGSSSSSGSDSGGSSDSGGASSCGGCGGGCGGGD